MVDRAHPWVEQIRGRSLGGADPWAETGQSSSQIANHRGKTIDAWAGIEKKAGYLLNQKTLIAIRGKPASRIV
jgi:hypothetical protein